MARKNNNTRTTNRRSRLRIPKHTHFVYSTDEFGNDATLVRYLGDQSGDLLYCWHPAGYALWCRISHLHRVNHRSTRDTLAA